MRRILKTAMLIYWAVYCGKVGMCLKCNALWYVPGSEMQLMILLVPLINMPLAYAVYTAYFDDANGKLTYAKRYPDPELQMG